MIGIDPADVDPRLLAEPRFTHLRKRGADVRRRELRDAALAGGRHERGPGLHPDHRGRDVTHPAIKISGLVLTLKLLDWALAAEVPHYLDQVRSWGFSRVAARQLSHNRQEICLAASG